MIVRVIVTLLLVLVQNSRCYDPCQTPKGQTGTCLPLQDCPSLYSTFDKHPSHPKIRNFLRRWHCGFVGSEPKFCCPSPSPAAPEPVVASSRLLPDRSVCGLHTNTKIIGGEKTEIDEFPWMALLQYKMGTTKYNPNAKSSNRRYFADDGSLSNECGGALINNRYVLTAAHCLLPELVRVRLGEYNTETNPDCVVSRFGKDCAPPAEDFGVEEQIVYKSYNPEDSDHYHDIGLIRLDRDVEYSDFIRPICLPLASDDIYESYVGQNLTVAGWGLTENEVKSTIKLKVQVPVQDLSDCTNSYKRLLNANLALDNGQICAGGVKGRDSCRADSGGPLMQLKVEKRRDPNFYVVGVVSFGPIPCGQKDLPGVYTKVSKYAAWIVENLKS